MLMFTYKKNKFGTNLTRLSLITIYDYNFRFFDLQEYFNKN